MREPRFEEILSRHDDEKQENPNEKLRWYKHRQVMVDMGPEYQARLKELREKKQRT